ncbi:MAG: ABC transporter ATP-binding protein/permease [Candidatus Saccharibacteria bacterium]|nr:ABC transporter ATP-binding protein/permease [Candidatus Saccharibacteria bacterium]
MLELKGITKVYDTGDLKQTALNKININFRKSEFASILGPSGSGKTTLLNIIGGLDHYTSGNLEINEVSTKKFKDRDWDTYRNHRIGFVFQAYNLIPHQTILQNVRLALTLSGISKTEGIARAKRALKEVGLEKHINKRPSQLSGGQMQRVAIARALVNDPEILLADEPTGALDSETSVQIMDLLKKVAEKRLVIMVTHNPELAKEYSTRIIELKDGKIINDSNPYDGKKDTKETKEQSKSKKKKTKMSFFTALSLSFKNLLTKKGRTVLVAFAGSIGIIGIALILAVSTGFQNYVDSIQEDALSSAPLTINEKTADLAKLLLGTTEGVEPRADGKISESNLLSSTINSIGNNDIKSFKKYLETNMNEVKDDLALINNSYSIEPLIYTIDSENQLAKLNPSSLFTSIYGSSSLFSSYSSMLSVFAQMPRKSMEHYKLLEGHYPNNYNEVLLVLPSKDEISDFLTYSLGLRDTSKLTSIMTSLMSGEKVTLDEEKKVFSKSELMDIDLRLIYQKDTYRYNEKYGVYEDMSENKEYTKNLYDNAERLKITGVAYMENGGLDISTGGIAYLPELTEHISNTAKDSEIVKKQLENKDINVFSGKPFNEEQQKFDFTFQDLVSVDEAALESAFNVTISKDAIMQKVNESIEKVSSSISADVKPAKTAFMNAFDAIINSVPTVITESVKLSDVDKVVEEFIKSESIKTILNNLETNYVIPADIFAQTYSGLIKQLLSIYIGAAADDPADPAARINAAILNSIAAEFKTDAAIIGITETFAKNMTEAVMKKQILTEIGNLTASLTNDFSSAFNVNPEKIAGAFRLNFTEDELARVASAMFTKTESSAASNLISLGYQDLDAPTSISFYFDTFEGKEHFMDFIDSYNDKMDSVDKTKVLKYSDTTGMLISSVKTIVDAVSYVLIAFVSISLIVSSIMIGVITYISVFERKKEIGILRAIGASKRNISNIFNAETFIIGFLSGLFGIGISYICIPIINAILHHFTGDIPLSAYLDPKSALILIIISVILTLIGGLIPARSASKKDPVEALRSE